MSNKQRLAGLGILLLIQIVFPLFFIYQKERIHDVGHEYLFAIEPVDPYDFFQGKYVSLNVSPLTYQQKNAEKFRAKDVVYAQFQQHKNNVEITGISTKRTKNSLKLIVSKKLPNRKLLFRLPFSRFYTEENKARQIERKIAQMQDTSAAKAFVHVKIYKGDFVITDISRKGTSLVSQSH